jgi:hypothetical protein
MTVAPDLEPSRRTDVRTFPLRERDSLPVGRGATRLRQVLTGLAVVVTVEVVGVPTWVVRFEEVLGLAVGGEVGAVTIVEGSCRLGQRGCDYQGKGKDRQGKAAGSKRVHPGLQAG